VLLNLTWKLTVGIEWIFLQCSWTVSLMLHCHLSDAKKCCFTTVSMFTWDLESASMIQMHHLGSQCCVTSNLCRRACQAKSLADFLSSIANQWLHVSLQLNIFPCCSACNLMHGWLTSILTFLEFVHCVRVMQSMHHLLLDPSNLSEVTGAHVAQVGDQTQFNSWCCQL